MVDLTKPVQTRGGRKVRILCTNRAGGLYPIVGLVDEGGGIEQTQCWTSKGVHAVGVDESDFDLVNVPPPKTKVKVFVELRLDEGRAVYGVAVVGRPPHSGDCTVLASTVVEMEYEVTQS